MQSYPSTSGEGFVVYQSLAEMTEMSTRLIRNKVDTIEKVLRYSVEQHGQKKALGTRQILAEEDEKQPDGRVMKKVRSRRIHSHSVFELTSMASNYMTFWVHS